MALLCLKKPKWKRLKLKACLPITLALSLICGQIIAQDVKPLDLGQKIPVSILHQRYPVIGSQTKPADSISLGQYKGKLILLDFWAAWCTNCIYKFELLDQLQERYKEKFQVILVNAKNSKDTPERMKGILTGAKAPYIKSNLTSIYNDVVLNKLFPHHYLPHYVWIGAKGEILAITGAALVNEATIQQFLADIAKQTQQAQEELSKKP